MTTEEEKLTNSREVILCGGGDIVGGELKEIDSQIINSSQNKKILVLDLTTNDPNKIEKYKLFLKEYFLENGATKIEFISDISKESNINLDEFGIIYLPGGDPIILLENILKRKIDLNYFRGIILGNSAGALILSKNMIVTKDEDFPETIVKEGLGIVPFSVEVHYDGSQDNELKKLKLNEDIYAIPEKNFVKINTYKIIFGGNIRIFKGAGA